MPDLIALYGAVAGSAGLLSLAWQIYARKEDRRTRLIFEAFHMDLEIRPDDDRYETAQRSPWNEEYRTEPGTSASIVNLSNHSVWLKGSGIDQPATDGICHTFQVPPKEIPPLRSYNDIWIPDWWAVGEQGMDLRAHPIRVYADLEHGETIHSGEVFLYPRLAKGRRGSKTPTETDRP